MSVDLPAIFFGNIARNIGQICQLATIENSDYLSLTCFIFKKWLFAVKKLIFLGCLYFLNRMFIIGADRNCHFLKTFKKSTQLQI